MSDKPDDLPDVPREEDGKRRRRNAADPDQVARASAREGRDRAQALADWRWLVKHPEGLRLLRLLLKPIDHNPYHQHANETARLCGQLEQAQWVRRQVWEAAPEALALILAQDIEAVRKERAQVQE